MDYVYSGWMKNDKTTGKKAIDRYISGFPLKTRRLLKQMRAAIRKAAPGAVEKISYGIPTYYLGENLVHFGGFADHVSFFPTSSGVRKFRAELRAYKTSPGTVQFSLDEKLPLALIARIVKFRVRVLKANLNS